MADARTFGELAAQDEYVPPERAPVRITVRPQMEVAPPKSFEDYLGEATQPREADTLQRPPVFGLTNRYVDPNDPNTQAGAQWLSNYYGLPGRLWAGDPRNVIAPEVPGQWSDRDEARAALQAGNMTLGGMGMGVDATTGAMPRGFAGATNTLGVGGGFMTPQQAKLFMARERGQLVPVETTEPIRRTVDYRDPSGRPVRTAPLPIGTEEAILGRGYDVATGARPPGPQPPLMQAAERKGPRMGDVADVTTPAGIRAYHGSPHDFDRFDINKIGTGEGGQAYGHGLYFAEAEPTALSYRNANFVTDRNWPVAGTNLDVPAWVARSAQTERGLEEVRQNFLGRVEEAKQKLAAGNHNASEQLYHTQRVVDALDAVKAGAELKKPGRMYEVNIGAKPEQMLNWDRPLQEQAVAGKIPLPFIEAAKNEAYNRGLASTSKQRADELWAMVKNPYQAPGEFVMRAASKGAPWKTSEALREAGIPGIQYLDQMSRGSGRGTSNYVLFDDKLIDILRKYGLAGMLGGGAAAMSSTARQDDYRRD